MKKNKIPLLFLLLVILNSGCDWIIKDAFGPKYRTVEIAVSDSRKLVCEETYSADLAAVFYDVDFVLKEIGKDDIKLGQATYNSENWDKKIKLVDIEDWIILLVEKGSYAKVLMTNKKSNISLDTTFSPLELRYDTLWKSKYDEIPAWVYNGQSKIDSIINNKLFVNFYYRLGLYEPFEFYNQTIEYNINTVTGDIRTKKIYGRIKN